MLRRNNKIPDGRIFSNQFSVVLSSTVPGIDTISESPQPMLWTFVESWA